jgi:hypothetical protein
MRRGLLTGTIEEIFARAEAYPLRELVIGIPEHAQKPVLLHLAKDATYQDPELRAASSKNIRDTVNYLGEMAGCLAKLGGHAPRRGAARDMKNLREGSYSIEASNAVASMCGHHGSGSVSGQMNKYADGRIENFGRECESVLPPVTPLTDLLAFQPQRGNTLRMAEWSLGLT